MHCPRRHSYWQSERLYWKGVFEWRATRNREQRTQENFCALRLAVSSFMMVRLAFGLSLASHLAYTYTGPTLDLFWWQEHLSVKMVSDVRISGRLAWYILGWHFFPFLVLPGFSSGCFRALRWFCVLLKHLEVGYLSKGVITMPNQCRWFQLIVSYHFPGKYLLSTRYNAYE